MCDSVGQKRFKKFKWQFARGVFRCVGVDKSLDMCGAQSYEICGVHAQYRITPRVELDAVFPHRLEHAGGTIGVALEKVPKQVLVELDGTRKGI